MQGCHAALEGTRNASLGLAGGVDLVSEGVCMHDQVPLMRPPHKVRLRPHCSACVPARAPWNAAGCCQLARARLIWRIGAACSAIWSAALCSIHECRNQALQHTRSNVNKGARNSAKPLGRGEGVAPRRYPKQDLC